MIDRLKFTIIAIFVISGCSENPDGVDLNKTNTHLFQMEILINDIRDFKELPSGEFFASELASRDDIGKGSKYLKDGWGNSLLIERKKNHFTIWSKGLNQIDDRRTGDDIVVSFEVEKNERE